MTLSLSYYPKKHSTITGSYAEECMNVKECRQRILNWKRSKSKRRSIVCISYVCSPHVFTLFLWRFLQRLKAYIHDFFLKPLNENVNSNFTTGSLDFNNCLKYFQGRLDFSFPCLNANRSSLSGRRVQGYNKVQKHNLKASAEY